MAGMAAAAAALVAAKRCMNAACGAPAPSPAGGEWRKGWPLRSGGFAVLCDKCGYASASSSLGSSSSALACCARPWWSTRRG